MHIRRYKNILILHIGAMENSQIFHQAVISPFANGKIKSRMSLSTRTHRLSHDIDDIFLDTWAQHTSRGRRENSNYQLNNFIPYASS